MDLKGIEYLKRKLDLKRSRVRERYRFYEMKNGMRDFNLTMPKEFRWLKTTLGWCTKAVDSMADRIVFREFENDLFDFNGIFALNNPDVLFDSAILSALISSCCFIYIYAEEGMPKLRVIDGSNATGIIDPTTNLLKEGYAVLERDDSDNVLVDAYFAPGKTYVYYKGIENPDVFSYSADYPMLVPIINRPDAKRPFGHSRISRSCMSIQEEAMRTLKRAEVSAEFYSFPQKYVTGLSDDVEFDNFKATLSSFLALYQDDNGNSPSVGQFQQQSMAPYTDQLRMFASLFAGETGLTLDDLGFVSQNPSSAEAIKASHENLRLEARKAQRTFGTGFLNVGYLASCLRDDMNYSRTILYEVKPKFEPIFEPDLAALSLIGDGAIKVNQAVPGYFGKDNLRDLIGYGASNDELIEIEETEEEEIEA